MLAGSSHVMVDGPILTVSVPAQYRRFAFINRKQRFAHRFDLRRKKKKEKKSPGRYGHFLIFSPPGALFDPLQGFPTLLTRPGTHISAVRGVKCESEEVL